MHNIEPNAGDSVKDFTATNMWYERLEKRYNFSLGPAILPLLGSDDLMRLSLLDPPFMKSIANTTVRMSSFHGKI